MWTNGAADLHKATNATKSGFFQKDVKTSDADDFYVFIYDEEDRAPQTQLKKGKRSMGYEKSRFERVLGFWCFSPGVGFKQIQKLNPRSIILTSGTLSPMNSFEAELQVEFK